MRTCSEAPAELFATTALSGSCSPLRQKHSRDACAVGRAQQRAQVVRVLHAVERQKEPPAGGVWRRRQQVLKLQQPALAQEGDDALMHLRADVPGELFAGFGVHPDAGSPSQFQELGQPGIAAAFALAGHRDVVDSLRAGAQRLLHRVQTVQNVHLSSVRG